MSTEVNIWAKGRNITLKQEIFPTLQIEHKLMSLPKSKKINISKILEGSDEQNLEQLNNQLLLLQGIDVDYDEKLGLYS